VVPAQPTTPLARDTAVWVLFVAGGGGGEGVRYDDDGTTTRGEGGWTRATHNGAPAGGGGATEVWVAPMVGTFSGAPQARRHVLQLRGAASAPLRVSCNGGPLQELLPPEGGLEEAYESTGWWLAGGTAAEMWYEGVVVVTDETPVEAAVGCTVEWA
jgi:hypothetical protein